MLASRLLIIAVLCLAFSRSLSLVLLGIEKREPVRSRLVYIETLGNLVHVSRTNQNQQSRTLFVIMQEGSTAIEDFSHLAGTRGKEQFSFFLYAKLFIFRIPTSSERFAHVSRSDQLALKPELNAVPGGFLAAALAARLKSIHHAGVRHM